MKHTVPAIDAEMGTGRPVIYRLEGYWAFMSNTYPCPVASPEDGIRYPSSEHAFQAAKSENITERMRISALPTWREAKGAGRALQLRDDWEQVKKEVMLTLVLAKFKQNPELAAKLTASGGLIIEGNNWNDDYWGMVRKDGGCWEGHNYLGQILMAVRMVLA